LHALLGLSDDTTERYLIALAKESRSQAELGTKVGEMLPSGESSQELINKLYETFGKKQAPSKPLDSSTYSK